jgi:hypothetical protein
MGIFLSKEKINFTKNIKYDLILEVTTYSKNTKFQEKTNTTSKDKHFLKNYLHNKLYRELNSIIFSDGKFFTNNKPNYRNLQKLNKNDIRKIKYENDTYIISISTKLNKINNEIDFYINDFIKEILEVLQHDVSSGGLPLYQKKEKYFLFPQKIENVTN